MYLTVEIFLFLSFHPWFLRSKHLGHGLYSFSMTCGDCQNCCFPMISTCNRENECDIMHTNEWCEETRVSWWGGRERWSSRCRLLAKGSVLSFNAISDLLPCELRRHVTHKADYVIMGVLMCSTTPAVCQYYFVEPVSCSFLIMKPSFHCHFCCK